MCLKFYGRIVLAEIHHTQVDGTIAKPGHIIKLQHPLLAALAGAIFVGVGVGLCVLSGGAPSGDDALAMSLSHRTRLNLSWIYLVSDLSVLALSLTYIPFSRIIYSLLTVVLSGQIIGWMQKIPIFQEPTGGSGT